MQSSESGSRCPASLGEVLERHRAFWEMAQVERPLLRVGRYEPLQAREPLRLAGGVPVEEGALLRPEAVELHYLVEEWEGPSSPVSGDFIQGVAPCDLCWNEAILGCPIRWRAGHVWSEPFLDGLGEMEPLRPAPDNPWLRLLLELAPHLAEEAAGRYPVCQPLLRGPIDMAAAALGDEALCWGLADEPERMRRLLGVCTDSFNAVARAWQEETPPFQQGYCLYGIWAPGTVVRTQCDNAALLSPQWYRDFLVSCDEGICARFDYPLMHTHSGSIAMLADALLEVRGLRAIQVSLDYPAGPPVVDLLPTLQKINRKKPLIITGGLEPGELELLLHSLEPRGLCLQVGLHD